MAGGSAQFHDAVMWARRLLSQLDEITELLEALGTMLMVMDTKLERIVEFLEEDA